MMDEAARDGVVIPNDGVKPILRDDQGAALMREFYEAGEVAGYSKVRMDRAQALELPGQPWFELGYVYGEVSARWSHRPTNSTFRHYESAAMVEFREHLADNADLARVVNQ